MKSNNERILLSHGSGGKLTHTLINEIILESFNNPILSSLTDAAFIKIEKKDLLFTTDSFVVKPIIFPGGDIGRLSVFGTVNDIAVMGGKPLFLSCAIILEEGFRIDQLKLIIKSMSEAAKLAGVQIVTGDTKVVEKGSGDGIFINTSGIGIPHKNRPQGNILPGDKIIINGHIGDHGIAIFSAREDFGLSSPVMSDCAPLFAMIKAILDEGINVKFMRDPTRGGIAATANEMVFTNQFGITLFEDRMPVREEVQSICDIVGFDPLYIANEGKVVMIVEPDDSMKAVRIMKEFKEGRDACVIGEINSKSPGKVVLETHIGGTRIVDMPVADQLPRIC